MTNRVRRRRRRVQLRQRSPHRARAQSTPVSSLRLQPHHAIPIFHTRSQYDSSSRDARDTLARRLALLALPLARMRPRVRVRRRRRRRRARPQPLGQSVGLCRDVGMYHRRHQTLGLRLLLSRRRRRRVVGGVVEAAGDSRRNRRVVARRRGFIARGCDGTTEESHVRVQARAEEMARTRARASEANVANDATAVTCGIRARTRVEVPRETTKGRGGAERA